MVECRFIRELTLHEADALTQLLPDFLAERRARVGLHGVMGDLGEIGVRPVPASESDQRESRRQEATVSQVVDRWQQLLGGQISGHAEEHQHARPGEPRDTPIARIAQRIRPHADFPPAASSRSMLSISSIQEAENFSTPCSSSTRTTSSYGTPSASSCSKTRRDSS